MDKESELFIPLWGLAHYILDTKKEENRAPFLLFLAVYNFSLLFMSTKLIESIIG